MLCSDNWGVVCTFLPWKDLLSFGKASKATLEIVAGTKVFQELAIVREKWDEYGYYQERIERQDMFGQNDGTRELDEEETLYDTVEYEHVAIYYEYTYCMSRFGVWMRSFSTTVIRSGCNLLYKELWPRCEKIPYEQFIEVCIYGTVEMLEFTSYMTANDSMALPYTKGCIQALACDNLQNFSWLFKRVTINNTRDLLLHACYNNAISVANFIWNFRGRDTTELLEIHNNISSAPWDPLPLSKWIHSLGILKMTDTHCFISAARRDSVPFCEWYVTINPDIKSNRGVRRQFYHMLFFGRSDTRVFEWANAFFGGTVNLGIDDVEFSDDNEQVVSDEDVWVWTDHHDDTKNAKRKEYDSSGEEPPHKKTK